MAIANSRLYTRTGDTGETSLGNGARVPKDALRVEAYGTLDEANGWIGVARAAARDQLLDRVLGFVQHRLFNCGAQVATPEHAGPPTIDEPDVAVLELAIDRFEARTGPLDRFILPAGDECASFLHVARAVCRRAERQLVSLSRESRIEPTLLRFLNRAGDLLFAAARYANAVAGRADVAWDADCEPPDLESLG
jgi:cob(I)alamin adenosyltransferase